MPSRQPAARTRNSPTHTDSENGRKAVFFVLSNIQETKASSFPLFEKWSKTSRGGPAGLRSTRLTALKVRTRPCGDSNRRTFFTGCFSGSATAPARCATLHPVSILQRRRQPRGKLPAHVVSGPVVRQNPWPFQEADSSRTRSSQTTTSIRLSMEGKGGSEGQGNPKGTAHQASRFAQVLAAGSRARFPGPPRENQWQLQG